MNPINGDNIKEDANPIAKKDNVEKVELNDIYVGRTFGYQNETYDAYNLCAMAKGFGTRRGRIPKSRANQKVIRRQLVCNKEGHKKQG